MTKLFVIAGHGAGDPGACANGYQEFERVRALATRMKALGGDSVTLGDFNRDYYADSGINGLNLSKDTCIVELHLDSGPASAKGGHVIIKYGYTPDRYDSALADNIAKLFPGRANSIVGRSDLANVNRAANKGFNYRLIENCFITNTGDITKYNKDIDAVAKAILTAFGITGKEEPKVASNSVILKAYDGTNPTKWWMRENDDGSISLRHVSTYKWLSIPNSKPGAAKVYEGTADKQNDDPRDPQKFFIDQTDKPGVIKLHPLVDRSLSLDVLNGTPKVGNTVQFYSDNKSEAQEFFLYKITGNQYYLVACAGMLPVGV